MRISSSLFRSAVVAGLAFAASCSSDSATSPTASANLSAAISQTTFGDASTFASSTESLTSVPGAAAPTFDPGMCTYSSSDNSFTCPSKSAAGVNFQLKYFLYNAAGVAMSAYDPAVTDRLRTVWDASGTLATTGPGTTVQLAHHSDLTLVGLLGTTRTLNGTSTDHDIVDTGTGNATTHTTVDVAGSTTNVVLPAAAGQFPASGLLASDVTIKSATGGISTTANLRGTLAFNGTKFALLTVSSGAIVHSCTIDLTGATSPRC